MSSSTDKTGELGRELLRIKAAINKGTYSESDIEVYRFCLGKERDLALIAAGYALSENLTEVKETAVQVLGKALADIRVSGVLPSSWAELAILEGLLVTDVATLLALKEDVITYLKRLLFDRSKMADLTNATSLVRRLASVNVIEAVDLLRTINGTSPNV